VKKILIIATLFFTLACQTLTGTPTSPPVAEPTAAPPSTTPTAIPTEVEASPAPTSTPAPVSGFEQIRILSKDGALKVQLEEQARFASALGLMPVVEFDASW
jgi:hypothetical protein